MEEEEEEGMNRPFGKFYPFELKRTLESLFLPCLVSFLFEVRETG